MKKSHAIVVGLAVIVVAGMIWDMTGAPPDASGPDQPRVFVSTVHLVPSGLPATVSAYGSIGAGAGGEESITIGAGGIIAAIPIILVNRLPPAPRWRSSRLIRNPSLICARPTPP